MVLDHKDHIVNMRGVGGGGFSVRTMLRGERTDTLTKSLTIDVSQYQTPCALIYDKMNYLKAYILVLKSAMYTKLLFAIANDREY